MGTFDFVPPGLMERLRRGADVVRAARSVRVYSHYDADGCTAAALLVKAFMREGKVVQVSLAHGLGEGAVARMNEEGHDAVVVSDIGSGQVDALEASRAPVVILDHHQPLRDPTKVTLVHCNPHLFGISGTKGACGATTSFLFTLVLDEANWDLAGVALAGCIGDRQAVGGFQGINLGLFEGALRRGIVTAERRLALHDLSIGEALTASIGPYWRGLSGRREEVEALLQRLGIDPSTPLRALGDGHAEALTSLLLVRLLEQGVRPETAETLVEEKYWIPSMGLFADDLEGVVNAAARLNREPLGVAMALGDPEALAQGRELRSRYVAEVMAELHRLEREGPSTKAHIQHFTTASPTLAGSLCGVAMQYIFDQEKPTLALAALGGTIKVSSRGTDYLIAKGLDLAVALREAAAAVGGNGGGHNIAAGATLPEGSEGKFLSLVDEIVGKQLGGKDRPR